jgi:hypothetical protein
MVVKPLYPAVYWLTAAYDVLVAESGSVTNG